MKKLFSNRTVKWYGIRVGALASTLTVMHYCYLYGPIIWDWGIENIPLAITSLTALLF